MQLGEFGANRAVPLDQRAAWTRAVRETAEAEGMGWCVWDFAGAFPIWDRETGRFIPELRAALLDQ
jgi:endoglucanase